MGAMRGFHDAFRVRRAPGVTGENAFQPAQRAENRAVLQNHFLRILRAGGCVTAVAVGGQMAQRAVIRGEGVLVCGNEQERRFLRQIRDAGREIARRAGHTYSGVYLPSSRMTWTTDDILAALFIAVAVLLIVALYHIILIAVDARKIVKRVERMSAQVEQVAMKPLSMLDSAMDWLSGQAEHIGKKKRKK